MKYNTIIIGAGISGLTIGAGLENPDFIILEARERVGGRVYTNSDTHLDMGAAWIHGSIDNPLNQFLNYDENMIPIAPSNPWIHSEDASIQYLTTSGEISEMERREMALQWQEMVKHIANVEDKTIDEACDQAFNQLSKTSQWYKSFLYMIEVWCGGSIKNIPSSYLQHSVGDYPGSHCLFKNGASTLVNAIIASSVHNLDDRIKCNQIVREIKYDRGHNGICHNGTGHNGTGLISIIIDDGSIYYCDKLCITIPPGPLLDIRFTPPLSQERVSALSHVKMGSYKKVQMVFDRNDVFWNDVPMLLTCDNNDNYTLWNNYMCSKNKPVIEAVCPANIGWAMAGHSDEEIIDQMLTNLRAFYPRAPDPVS